MLRGDIVGAENIIDAIHEPPKGRRQRPRSGTEPDKKSVAALFENFGSMFVVAATEKRRRFHPKKKQEESIEEVKERERCERREAAAKRLMERADAELVRSPTLLEQ